MNSYNQKILIVDDIEDNRFTLERRLSRNGYTAISQADCGKKALELVKAESFDLILLDLMMPDISGLDVLKTLKADPKNRSCLLYTSPSPRDRQKSRMPSSA